MTLASYLLENESERMDRMTFSQRIFVGLAPGGPHLGDSRQPVGP